MTPTDPVAVVTGAASGIGRATCERLVAAGCRVLAVDRDADRLESLRGPAVIGIAADVADPDARRALVAEVELAGGLRYLVNAAGILRPRSLPDVTLDDVRSVLAVNLEAPLFLSLDLAGHFGPGGAIVNVSSAAAKMGTTTELAAYAASKAALLSITRTLAFEYAARGLRVNAVCPGIIDTPMQEHLLRSLAESRQSNETDVDGLRLRAVPLRRAGQSAEVADVIWFLLSPGAGYMTGQAINVTGGQVTWWRITHGGGQMMTNVPPVPPGSPPTSGPPGSGDVAIDQATRLAMFRSMLEIRLVEQGAFDLFLQGMVKGTSHLAHGQEAIAVGFAAAMRPDDYTFCTYRGHHHTLARGVPFELVLGELMQRAGGLNGGKGGSMHLTSVDHGVMGSYAIVGAHLPVACGTGWSAQLRGTGQVTACFFGDGTTNIGAFHEALNIAAIWKLPVVFVCENNQYMEYTPIASVTSVPFPAADRASAYGLDRIIIDGNDVDACHLAAHAAYRRARAGEGPSLIEAETYRHGGHSRADPATYRPPGELQEWLRKDPIPRYRERLLGIGVADETLASIEHEVKASVKAAIRVAKAMPMADPAVVERDLWADGGVAWRS